MFKVSKYSNVHSCLLLLLNHDTTHASTSIIDKLMVDKVGGVGCVYKPKHRGDKKRMYCQYPQAYAVQLWTRSWTSHEIFFMINLRRCIGDHFNLVIISDRHPSISNVIKQNFQIYFMFCALTT